MAYFCDGRLSVLDMQLESAMALGRLAAESDHRPAASACGGLGMSTLGPRHPVT